MPVESNMTNRLNFGVNPCPHVAYPQPSSRSKVFVKRLNLSNVMLSPFDRRGENGRRRGGAERRKFVDQGFEMTNRDDVRFEDERLRASDAMTAADLGGVLDCGDRPADL